MRNRTRTRFPFHAALTATVLFCACSKKPPQNLIPAGALMAASMHFEYAVYMMPSHAKGPSAVLRHALSKEFANLRLVEELPKEPREMIVTVRTERNVGRKYAPPDLETLKYSGHGLSREQAETLQKSREAFVMEFAHPKEYVWTALRAADQLVEELARETGGMVWDEETREVFSPDAWHQRRLASWTDRVPDISTQTVIHTYRNGEFVRAITLGMSKAGLPDVVVAELPWSSENQIINLINIFSQFMAEGAVTKDAVKFKLDVRAVQNAKARDTQVKSLKPNSTGVACLTLGPGRWEEGDPKNQLIQLTFNRYTGNDAHAKQEAALSSLFGSEESITELQHTDELLEASRKANANLPRLHKDFEAGLPPGEYIEVKAPFKTPSGGNEWMWVEVSSWKEHTIKGVLNNDPAEALYVHSGQVVEVREEEVFDYIRHYPDKRAEGNTTGEIIRRMEQENKTDKERAVGPDAKTSRPSACTD